MRANKGDNYAGFLHGISAGIPRPPTVVIYVTEQIAHHSSSGHISAAHCFNERGMRGSGYVSIKARLAVFIALEYQYLISILLRLHCFVSEGFWFSE